MTSINCDQFYGISVFIRKTIFEEKVGQLSNVLFPLSIWLSVKVFRQQKVGIPNEDSQGIKLAIFLSISITLMSNHLISLSQTIQYFIQKILSFFNSIFTSVFQIYFLMNIFFRDCFLFSQNKIRIKAWQQLTQFGNNFKGEMSCKEFDFGCNV